MKRSSKLWTSLLLAAALAACGGDETDPENPEGGAGTVTGVVTDSTSGARLSGVKVAVGAASATTNERGEYTLVSVAEGAQVVRFEKAEYAPGFRNVTVGTDGVVALTTLKPEGRANPYDPRQAGTLVQRTEAGPYAVFFQPNTLNTTDTNLTVRVTPVDPTKEREVLPGRLETPSAMLVPLTFADFTIYDSRGQKVNLKPGTEAVVELPVPADLRDREQYALGQTIHCYSYNPDTGQWEDFVVGTVVASSIDGTTPVVRASIKHFSWYGAAPETNDCIDVWVKVTDKDGKPMKGVKVEAFPGGTATTGDDGSALLLTARDGSSTFTATRTWIDTEGTVMGEKGAKIIDFGKVEEELVGLVPKSCRGSGLVSGAAPGDLRGTSGNPLAITLAPLGRVSYKVGGWVSESTSTPGVGSVIVSLDTLLPGGETGEGVGGAIVKVSAGADSVTLQGFEGADGLYMGELPYRAGQRYLLTVDADGNGSIDGSGSVVAAGTLTWVSPTEGAAVSGGSVTARWTSTAGAGSGELYWAAFERTDAPEGSTTAAWYIGTDTQTQVHPYDPMTGLPTSAPLPAGSYRATVTSFSGPWGLAAAGDITVTPNVTGAIVGGEFFSFGTSAEVTFTVQ